MLVAVDAVAAAGTALAAAGLSLCLWAALQLRFAGAPRVLVEEGPYRFSRNPMALGLAAALAGTPLALGLPLLAALAPAYLAWVRWVRIPAEEARLQHYFGGWYSDYRAQVRRWI